MRNLGLHVEIPTRDPSEHNTSEAWPAGGGHGRVRLLALLHGPIAGLVVDTGREGSSR